VLPLSRFQNAADNRPALSSFSDLFLC
jgi:hypothetical protein